MRPRGAVVGQEPEDPSRPRALEVKRLPGDPLGTVYPAEWEGLNPSQQILFLTFPVEDLRLKYLTPQHQQPGDKNFRA